MAKVGIGVITIQKRQLDARLLNLISQPTQFYVFTDYERRGPAYGRNECIKHLYDAGCEHIFLFDDDTYPVVSQWQDYFIDAAQRTGLHGFGYPHRAANKLIRREDGIEYWQWCTAPFHYLSRTLIDTVGYFNPAYVTYGYEDTAYLYRSRKSKLCGPYDADPSPEFTDVFIHSQDIQGDPENFDAEANMSAEAKDEFIKLNKSTFQKEIEEGGKIYMPYATNQ